MNKVNQITPVTENKLVKIVLFASRASRTTQHLQTPALIESLVGKMPLSKRIQWMEH